MPRKARAVPLQELLANFSTSLRRTSTRPTILGYTPMDKQKQFHSSMARGRAFIGGNRSGKTVSGGAEAVMWLTGKHPFRPTPRPPVYGRGVAVDFDHGVDLIMKPEVARWMPQSELINGSWDKSYNKSSHVLTLANGSTLEFLSTDQALDKHAGTSRHFVWFDEEPPQEYFNENLIRLVDVGGSWWLTMTPIEGMSWTFDDIFLAAQINKEIGLFTATMDENVYINSNEIDMYLTNMTGEERKARREGKYVQLGGLIYQKYWDTERNLLEPIVNGPRWETYKKTWAHFCTMDHGFNNPTCWLWMCADTDGRIVIYDEYYKDHEIVQVHAYQIRERNRLLGIDFSYFVGDPSIRNTDPITGTSVQLEYQINGISIVPGNNDVRAGINRVARMLENGQLFITRNCEKLLWEMNRYRWGKWSSRKITVDHNAKEEPLKKDDHAMDAMRYGVASRFSAEDLTPKESTNPLDVPQARLLGKPLTDLEVVALLRDTVPDSEYTSVVDSMLGGEY